MSAEAGARNTELKQGGRVLVCFAVKEEAKPFREALGSSSQVDIVITGMGEGNTRAAFEAAIATARPGLVLTCGFAGGLRPGLQAGSVLYECTSSSELRNRLEKAGAQPGKFAFATSVAVTARQKRVLWEQSHADAVEMESHVIQKICKEHNIACATVRVILDAAEVDLPLDFNELMTSDQTLSFPKLILALLRSPGKIPALLQLQKETRAAAHCLGKLLSAFLRN